MRFYAHLHDISNQQKTFHASQSVSNSADFANLSVKQGDFQPVYFSIKEPAAPLPKPKLRQRQNGGRLALYELKQIVPQAQLVVARLEIIQPPDLPPASCPGGFGIPQMTDA